MAPRTTLHAYDGLTGGRLQSFLSGLRADGESFATCRSRLADEFGVDVSVSTVRRWCLDLDPDPKDAA